MLSYGCPGYVVHKLNTIEVSLLLSQHQWNIKSFILEPLLNLHFWAKCSNGFNCALTTLLLFLISSHIVVVVVIIILKVNYFLVVAIMVIITKTNVNYTSTKNNNYENHHFFMYLFILKTNIY